MNRAAQKPSALRFPRGREPAVPVGPSNPSRFRERRFRRLRRRMPDRVAELLLMLEASALGPPKADS